ncbi:hypothetical protein [Amycolatopsis sp. NPDC058986]|uniref:hypothetical protein n=1 Tax=Actinomycetes TaxID=1760 RepID=UPI00366CADF5
MAVSTIYVFRDERDRIIVIGPDRPDTALHLMQQYAEAHHVPDPPDEGDESDLDMTYCHNVRIEDDTVHYEEANPLLNASAQTVFIWSGR